MRDLLDRLDGWRDEQIEFLARLVNHDSGTDDVMDVNRVGAILVERLERLGFSVRRVVNDRFGDHLVGDKPGTGPNRAHSAEEFIEVATLLERTKMLALFLDRWAAEFERPTR